MPPPNLKFRLMRTWHVSPNGYRLATVKEVRNHSSTIKLFCIPQLSPHYLIEEGDWMHFLGGCMLFLGGDFKLQLLQVPWSKYLSSWKVLVKETEWDEDAGTWRTKNSACYSSDGVRFRKQLYLHIPLSHQDRQTALQSACCCHDVELLYHLLTTTSSSEMESLLLSSSFQDIMTFADPLVVDPSFSEMVKCLLNSSVPFKLPLKPNSDGKTAIHYAIEFLVEFNICHVEFFVELFSPEIIHWENSDGKSFFAMAENVADDVFTKLLSLSEKPLKNHLVSIKPRFKAVLVEAVEKGYAQLLDELLDLKGEMAIDASSLIRDFRDKDQKTLLHYAAESGNPHVFQLVLTSFESVKGVDKFGRNVLHSAAKGKSGHRVVEILKEKESTLLDLMKSRDSKGRTPLHIASSKGYKIMVDRLLAVIGDDRKKVTKYVKETDFFCRTTLQMASRGGHTEVVRMLIEKVQWNTVQERDVNGKTALHYAAEAVDPEDAVDICNQLLQSCGHSDEQLSLLLWASAGGIGTADEGKHVHPFVKTFLEGQKESHKSHLLREAALRDNVEMAWELLNRGADIDDLRDPLWSRKSDSDVKNVLRQLEMLKEQGRDQPSMEDKLGRNVFAEGLAALFLNRFIESPITVGICGEWGMGKSSLMIQTEKNLLITAAQLTFPNLLKFENFGGAKKISLSTKGRKIYQTIKTGASRLLVQREEDEEDHRSEEDEEDHRSEEDEDRPQEIQLFKLYHKISELVKNFCPPARQGKDPLVEILQEYQPQYHAIYKSLACMDSNQLLQSPKRTKGSQQEHALRQVPRMLTIRYNAWQYRDQHEAWAGLAVTITKEIENSMTRAQWFNTCWRYSWNKNNVNIYFQVLLPCLLATFLAGWIAWAALILIKEVKSNLKDLIYGSVPFTIIALVWTVLKAVMSVVKPVSDQMLGYITSPDHTNQLGYQEQVISDINFLKRELGKKPHWFFSFVSGEWCWNWFGLCADNVENTSIRKFRPASADQLRIITFVDDLDRCEEKVILQVLSAVNLVLARCEINVVMGIDKRMMERAIRRSFEDVEDNDIAERFLSKIVQIPLSLPDPTDDQTNKFLEYHLGHELQDELSSEDDNTDYDTADEVQEEIRAETVREEESRAEIRAEDVVYEEIRAEDVVHEGSRAEDVSEEESRAEHDDKTVVDIDCCNPSQTGCPGIIKKAADWIAYFLNCSFSSACNISSESKHMKEESGDGPLASSKGARLMREMLLSKYTKEEADIFKNLKKFATGNQKLPREWKRLFNYHKLAWNILSKRGDVYSLPTWKVELAVWIFVCWEWKKEMNTVIKGWSKFARTARQNEDGDARGGHGPSLRQIVENYVELQKSEKSKQPQENSTAKTGDDFFKVKGCLRQENLVTLYAQRQVRDVIEEGPNHNRWKNLRKALKIRDVSMEGIQLFQQFRLHCETDHLPWPVDDEDDDESEPE